MPYNKGLEIPVLEKKEEDGSCTYTHNHANHYWYTTEELTLKTRKEARAFMEGGKKEINRCIFFMKNCLEDETLTSVQKAILKQAIKNDEDLIKLLDNAKPSPCTIL